MSKLEDIRNAAKAAVGQKQDERTIPLTTDELRETVEGQEYYYAYFAPTNDQELRLIIYSKDMFIMPRYDFLQDVVFHGLYEFVGLIYPHQRIKIYGRNLKPIVQGLRSHSIEWIREYVPPYMKLAPDHDENKLPVITEIEIEGAIIDPFNPKRD